MRTLLIALTLGFSLAACDSLDAFDTLGGTYTATVRGEQDLDLSGGGTLGLVSDAPPVSSIYLSGVNAPAFRFEVPTESLQPGTYSLPDDATATFELDSAVEPVYTATSGTLTVTRVADGRAQGSFSFTATRASGTVTATGTFATE